MDAARPHLDPPLGSLRAATWTGLAIWAVGLAGLGFLYETAPRQATAALVAVATFYYAGQFGAIPLGLAMGGHPLLIGLFVWAADAAGLLAFFSLTQLSVDRLARRHGLVARWIRNLRRRAHARRAFVERYGPWALYAFTSLPFLFNSPILGAVLGRLAGLRPRATLTALLAAITVMSAVWTLVFHQTIEGARALDERLPWVMGLGSVGITLLVAGAVSLIRLLRGRTEPVPVPDE